MAIFDKATSGLAGLDKILHNLRLGDNVVFQVDSIESYLHFVKPFVAQALKDKRNLIYIRFAKHAPLIENQAQVTTYKLDASQGFESFTKKIHEIITKEGKEAFYVFDCLSDLLSAWATDLMIGNFFMVTCPYLFRLETIAYFALMRDNHSFKTIARIRETTQLLLDVYNFEDKYYLHALKVWKRHSPTMFLPHIEEGQKFSPIVNSAEAARLFYFLSQKGVENAERKLDYWDKLFIQAEELIASPDNKAMLDKLVRIMLARENRMVDLIGRHFTLADLINIKARMIGTGFIGGKTLGMLLARKILKVKKDLLEPHDSFYIGSDVFYTYIVENGWWELWLEQKTQKGFFNKAKELKEKLLHGKFPEEITEKFQQMIEYFGQSPIIVRSSSLLDDSFGNAFAGKYESLFCVSQGSPQERYKNFEDTVRRVFASTMNEDALNYRLQRGLAGKDEQMALLVQRVSGSHHKKYFFPYVAGVGFSYNTFVWDEGMDPKAGMLRLVFGLGTRAVNRLEGDYPAIVALDAPLKRPYAGTDNLKRFSQHEVDALDIEINQLKTVSLEDFIKEESVSLDLEGKRDLQAEEKLKRLGSDQPVWVITFEKLLSKTSFAQNMKEMFEILNQAYDYPVDVEFTLNFSSDDKMQINLVQCRPLQARGISGKVSIPKKISADQLLFKSKGNFMGGNVSLDIERLVFVDPKTYGDLLIREKYELARMIGSLNNNIPTLLIGPGRWGTRDPSLGVPVKFAEISKVKALVEIDDPERGFSPELSFGSHFFLDLVEADIFYTALFMDNEENCFNHKWIATQENSLEKLLPEAKKYSNNLKIIEFNQKPLKLLSDITRQVVVCLT